MGAVQVSATATALDAERREANIRHIDHVLDVAMFPRLQEWNPENIGRRTAEYLEKCKEDGIRVNLSDYALALGTTPDGLNELVSDKRLTDETRAAVLKGISMIEDLMLVMMSEQRINPVTGIFMLKNHFGYKDQSEISFKGHIETDKQTLQAKYRAVVDDD